MPGLHSPEKLLLRRMRAIRSGHLSPKAPPGKSFVAVDSDLKGHVKAIVASLEQHKANQAATQRCDHRARDSSLAVKHMVGDCEPKLQLAKHQKADRAKHRLPIPRASVISDSNDAWSWNVDAPEFFPCKVQLELDALIDHDCGCVGPSSHPQEVDSLLVAANRLIDDQNYSISCLIDQIQEAHWQMHVSDSQLSLLQRVQSLEERCSTFRVDPNPSCRVDVEPGSHFGTKNSKNHKRVKDTAIAEKHCVTDLEKANNTIMELRAQAAAHAAIEARRSELQSAGRLLKSFTVHGGTTNVQFPIDSIFLQFVGKSAELDLSEPYLVSAWQIDNLRALLDGLVQQTFVRRVRLLTHKRSLASSDIIDQLIVDIEPVGLLLQVAYAEELHLRELRYDNGVVIVSDRGLDIYRSPDKTGIRSCRTSLILYFEIAPDIKAAQQVMLSCDSAPLRRNRKRAETRCDKIATLSVIFPDRGFGFLAGVKGSTYFRIETLPLGCQNPKGTPVAFHEVHDGDGRGRALRIELLDVGAIRRILLWWKKRIQSRRLLKQVHQLAASCREARRQRSIAACSAWFRLTGVVLNQLQDVATDRISRFIESHMAKRTGRLIIASRYSYASFLCSLVKAWHGFAEDASFHRKYCAPIDYEGDDKDVLPPYDLFDTLAYDDIAVEQCVEAFIRDSDIEQVTVRKLLEHVTSLFGSLGADQTQHIKEVASNIITRTQSEGRNAKPSKKEKRDTRAKEKALRKRLEREETGRQALAASQSCPDGHSLFFRDEQGVDCGLCDAQHCLYHCSAACRFALCSQCFIDVRDGSRTYSNLYNGPQCRCGFPSTVKTARIGVGSGRLFASCDECGFFSWHVR